MNKAVLHSLDHLRRKRRSKIKHFNSLSSKYSIPLRNIRLFWFMYLTTYLPKEYSIPFCHDYCTQLISTLAYIIYSRHIFTRYQQIISRKFQKETSTLLYQAKHYLAAGYQYTLYLQECTYTVLFMVECVFNQNFTTIASTARWTEWQ